MTDLYYRIPWFLRLGFAIGAAPVLAILLLVGPPTAIAMFFTTEREGFEFWAFVLLGPLAGTLMTARFVLLPTVAGSLLGLAPLHLILRTTSARHRYRYYFLCGLIAGPFGLFFPALAVSPFTNQFDIGLEDILAADPSMLAINIPFMLVTSLLFWLLTTRKSER